jgi:hypothetical protein
MIDDRTDVEAQVRHMLRRSAELVETDRRLGESSPDRSSFTGDRSDAHVVELSVSPLGASGRRRGSRRAARVAIIVGSVAAAVTFAFAIPALDRDGTDGATTEPRPVERTRRRTMRALGKRRSPPGPRT